MKNSGYRILLLVLTVVFLHACYPARNYLHPDGPKWKGNFATEVPFPLEGIKVVTFNIKLAQKIEHAIHDLRELPELQDADIILLQEMDDKGTEQIAKILHYNYVYYPASVHSRYDNHFGNAILSKWPISEETKIILPHESPRNNQRRIAVSATVTIDQIPIKVYNLHTETIWLRGSKRREQVKHIAEHISRQQPREYAIVGGDFNTVRKKNVEEITQIFKKVRFEWATEGMGSTSKIFLPLDHIYTKGWHILDAGKVENTKASDHFPVWVILKNKDRNYSATKLREETRRMK